MLKGHVASGIRGLFLVFLVAGVGATALADETATTPNPRVRESAPASPQITISITTTSTRDANGEEVRRVTTQTGYWDGQGMSRTEFGGFAIVRGASVPGGAVATGPAGVMGMNPGTLIAAGQQRSLQAPFGQVAASAPSEVLPAGVDAMAVTQWEELGRSTIRGIEVIGTRSVVDPGGMTAESWKDRSGRMVRSVSRVPGDEATTTVDHYYLSVPELPPALFDVPPGAAPLR